MRKSCKSIWIRLSTKFQSSPASHLLLTLEGSVFSVSPSSDAWTALIVFVSKPYRSDPLLPYSSITGLGNDIFDICLALYWRHSFDAIRATICLEIFMSFRAGANTFTTASSTQNMLKPAQLADCCDENRPNSHQISVKSIRKDLFSCRQNSHS